MQLDRLVLILRGFAPTQELLDSAPVSTFDLSQHIHAFLVGLVEDFTNISVKIRRQVLLAKRALVVCL
ncbi:hypothetical protein D3C77_781590 [compost metagenome]